MKRLLDASAAPNIDGLVVGGCMTQFCIDTTCRRAVSLGFDVSLVSDGHMTTDTSRLHFPDVIAHHNENLNGLNAGRNRIDVVSADKIDFVRARSK